MRSSLAPMIGCSLLLLLPAVLLGGCEDEDQARSQITITSVADPQQADALGADVFQSDVLDAGEDKIPLTADDGIYEDELLVTVENRPANSALGVRPDGPFGQVVLTSYRIVYDVPDEELEPIDGALHLVVPSGSSVTASLVVVSALAKQQPPLSSLVSLGGELLGSATLTLAGYELTSEDALETTATIQIHFANWADPGDD